MLADEFLRRGEANLRTVDMLRSEASRSITRLRVFTDQLDELLNTVPRDEARITEIRFIVVSLQHTLRRKEVAVRYAMRKVYAHSFSAWQATTPSAAELPYFNNLKEGLRVNEKNLRIIQYRPVPDVPENRFPFDLSNIS